MEKKKYIPYKPHLKELARQLRNNSTLGEVLLWKELKGSAFLGLDFHRQKPIDAFIVDFYCPDLLLAIEIDGDSNDYSFEQDYSRQARLEQLGVRFLRFTDRQVKHDMANVLRVLENWVLEQHDTHPQPLSRGELICVCAVQ